MQVGYDYGPWVAAYRSSRGPPTQNVAPASSTVHRDHADLPRITLEGRELSDPGGRRRQLSSPLINQTVGASTAPPRRCGRAYYWRRHAPIQHGAGRGADDDLREGVTAAPLAHQRVVVNSQPT
jgi:hypothetical protein